MLSWSNRRNRRIAMTQQEFEQAMLNAGFKLLLAGPRSLARLRHPDTGDVVYEVPFGESFGAAHSRIVAELADERRKRARAA